jgi:hypothetical protein
MPSNQPSKQPHEATSPEELVAALKLTTQPIVHVPRQLLIQTIGVEAAQELLPELPKFISVNVSQTLSKIK